MRVEARNRLYCQSLECYLPKYETGALTSLSSLGGLDPSVSTFSELGLQYEPAYLAFYIDVRIELGTKYLDTASISPTEPSPRPLSCLSGTQTGLALAIGCFSQVGCLSLRHTHIVFSAASVLAFSEFPLSRYCKTPRLSVSSPWPAQNQPKPFCLHYSVWPSVGPGGLQKLSVSARHRARRWAQPAVCQTVYLVALEQSEACMDNMEVTDRRYSVSFTIVVISVLTIVTSGWH